MEEEEYEAEEKEEDLDPQRPPIPPPWEELQASQRPPSPDPAGEGP